MEFIIFILIIVLLMVTYKYFQLIREMREFSDFIDYGTKGNLCDIELNEKEVSKLKSKIYKFLKSNEIRQSKLKGEKEKTQNLIADISHQTKTPITNLNLYINLLEKENKSEYFDIIKYELEKLDFLIKNLVKSSRLESNIISLEKMNVNFKNLILDVVSELEPQAIRKNIKIIKNLEDFNLNVDLRWTKEAIHNILDNAIKYSPENSQVIINSYKSSLNYNLDIINKCEDIGDLSKLFTRFYRGENSVLKDGLGLGLFITREILEKENAQIKAIYNDNKIKFELDFPL
ncbi:two-component sensor histidine kinase [Peptoniphilus sp. MSJ-1]|uniref:histidine kinase n=1 Tax=Peptoniphilus ovalis TaxID=2841503 RepID=A0ABS6FIM9_9FIRM|nr:histidine kinase dimerization/phospho-acceptor domain-containing protein [Peptoniphilus ovalis]MBU5670030.1 two-component sensor histidine kinase [Peptoniphilus ovalis]